GYDRDNTGNRDAGVSEMVAGISCSAGRNTGSEGGYREHVHETGKFSHALELAKPQGFPWGFDGGADQDRTDDLYNAIVALSQLSYGPILVRVATKSSVSVAARGIFRRFTKSWQDLFSKNP